MDYDAAPGPTRTDRLTAAPVATASEIAAAAVALAEGCGALLICTDFDGTLAPIVSDPSLARAVPGASDALAALATRGDRFPAVRVAVVTARDAADLQRQFPMDDAIEVVGSAGFERRRGGRLDLLPEAIPWLPALGEAARDLRAAVGAGRIVGARVESKRCGVVLHTRGLPPEVEGAALDVVAEIARATGLRVIHGKRSLEMRPPIDCDKADAVAAMVAEMPPHAGLLVAGDDLPDIAMLRVAAAAGGIGVAVADQETNSAVLEAATLSCEGPWTWVHSLVALANALTG